MSTVVASEATHAMLKKYAQSKGETMSKALSTLIFDELDGVVIKIKPPRPKIGKKAKRVKPWRARWDEYDDS